MNLKVSNSVTTKTYALTNAAPAKPYLNVSNSFLPLTTNTTSGLKLKVTKNNNTYRALEYGTVSSSDTFYTSANVSDGLSSTTGLTRASTSGTTYLTRASTSDTKYGTRASTSGTTYLTRASTSDTKYGTRVSTSGTTYLTRASTSGTTYLTRASTSGTTYYTRASTSGTASDTYFTEMQTWFWTAYYMTNTLYNSASVSGNMNTWANNQYRSSWVNFPLNSNAIIQNDTWLLTIDNSSAVNATSYNANGSYTNNVKFTTVPSYSRYDIMMTSNKPIPWLPQGNYNWNSKTHNVASLSSCRLFTYAAAASATRNNIGRTSSLPIYQREAVSLEVYMKPGATYVDHYLTRASTSNVAYGTRASTSNTVYGTRASTSNTVYGTRASTSGTTYYTRVSTSGTNYGTRASTSDTTYLTRVSTSGTNYGTRASTSGYSGVSSSSISTTSWI